MSDETCPNGTAGPVRLSGALLCASMQEVDIVRVHLPEHVRLTRAEPGCMSFNVWQSDDPLIWNVEERFRDRSAFAHHQERTRASAWWDAKASILRDYEIFDLD